MRAAGTEMRCSRALGVSGAAGPGAGASGRAEGRRGDERKIEAVEVMAAALGGAEGSGAAPGVTGLLGAGMYRELVAVTGPEDRGVLGEPGEGPWLETPVVRLCRGVGSCGEGMKGDGADTKGAGTGPKLPKLSFALLGARGLKITEVVVLGRCPCKPGVKGLADLLKMLGAGEGAPPPGRKGLGLVTGAGKGLGGSTAVSGGALWARGGDCTPSPLSTAAWLSGTDSRVLETARWRCFSKS